MNTLLKPEEIDLIIKGEHPSPHSVLGNHKVKLDGSDSIVIRTFVPGATTTSVILDSGATTKLPMTKIHSDGLFEKILEDICHAAGFDLSVSDVIDLHNRGNRTATEAGDFLYGKQSLRICIQSFLDG